MKEVIIIEYPISDRYCTKGDFGTLDTKRNKIRVGGVWFDFDERWCVVPVGGGGAGTAGRDSFPPGQGGSGGNIPEYLL